MSFEDAFENERKGRNAGLNPMFGDWQHRFPFPPVPYGDGGVKRTAFRNAIQAELTNHFFYSNQIRIEITLFLDIQTVLETSETADLDNYAKSILDGLKGPGGILLDDAQVQTLIISYLDNYGRDGEHFDVAITAAPDDFILKPVSFYEMPDRLWYPHGRRLWTDGEIDEQSDRNHYTGLLMLEIISSAKADARHQFRKVGMDRLRAYQRAMLISFSTRGFHRSRVDPGFEMFDRRSWRVEFETWKCGHEDEIAEIEEILIGVTENYKIMADLLAGKFPEDGSGQ
jgi:Holliday junction resolvase RusA-like endonuclease